ATGLHLALETTRYTPRAKPVTVIPYGVDLARFSRQYDTGEKPSSSADARAAADGSPEGVSLGASIVIGTTARLSPEKGLGYLTDAFARLHDRYGDRVRLRIAGEGPERDALEHQ